MKGRCVDVVVAYGAEDKSNNECTPRVTDGEYPHAQGAEYEYVDGNHRGEHGDPVDEAGPNWDGWRVGLG